MCLLKQICLYFYVLNDNSEFLKGRDLLVVTYEHSEQARAPHTNRPRDVPQCGALSSLQKPLKD